MIDTKFIDGIVKQLNEAIPPSLRALQKDFEQTVRMILQSAFAKLELVTREEFDTQARVLAKTRTKLEALEKKLTELEEHLPKKAPVVKKKKAGQSTS